MHNSQARENEDSTTIGSSILSLPLLAKLHPSYLQAIFDRLLFSQDYAVIEFSLRPHHWRASVIVGRPSPE
jgi:hypothetical protein